jgi:trans-aconitate 2-methyltransferase
MHKWDAQDYQKNSGIQLKWGRELINKLKLQGNERVLDIGCGDGKVTAEIAAILPAGSVTGIDNSPEMISLACQTFPAADYSNLRFMQMDACKLSFSGELDIVFSNAVLHWVSDHRSVLKGISRGLKKPGRILLQMGGKGNVEGMMSVVSAMIRQPAWENYFQGFANPFSFNSPEEYGKWLAEAGLKPLRVELIGKDLAQQGKEGLTSWFRTTWHPFFHRVPAPGQQAFIDEAVDTYMLAHPADAGGMVHVAAVRLEVEAEKI